MKRIPAIFVLLGLLPAVAPAYQLRVGETTNALVLPAGAQIEEEALWAANSVDIQGTTVRDLWLLATAAVRFDGETGGDLRRFPRPRRSAERCRATCWPMPTACSSRPIPPCAAK